MFCEKMTQSHAKKFPKSQSKKEVPRKEKGQPEEKEKAQANRQEEKKAVAAPGWKRTWTSVTELWLKTKAKDPFAP